METIFPDEIGASGTLIFGWRRRPGAPAGDFESVTTVIFKRAYSIDANTDPAAGSVAPLSSGDVDFVDIRQTDFPNPVDHEAGQRIEYESDLVPHKPEADLLTVSHGGAIPVSIAVDGIVRMTQPTVPAPAFDGLAWEKRFGNLTRATDGGAFSTLIPDVANPPNDTWTPPPVPLPPTFRNRFYNGYRRDHRNGSSVPYPGAGAEISIGRVAGDSYGFSLPNDRPEVEHGWYVGAGRDDPCLWRSRRVPMDLDTLMMEPDRDRAYAVWRAAWPTDVDPDGSGSIPFGDNRRVTVIAEGA